MSDNLTTGRAMAFERLLSEDAIMLPQYRKLGGRGIVLAKALNRPFEFERTDTAYSKTLDFLPANWKGAAVESIGGKTVVWNQLQAPSTAPSDRSRNGVTYSITNGGKSIVANGTASSLSYQNFGYTNGERVQIVQGHKYLLTGCPSGGGSTTYRLDLNAVGIGYDEGNGRIGTASSTPSPMPYIYAQVASGYTATNLTFTPQLFDLTLMFGAGNEPVTVEAFRAMYPASYYAYNPGELISAGVTGAVSRGKNLCDVFTRTLGTMSNGGNNTLPRTFDYTKYYKGATRNNYFSGSATKCDINADNSINYTTATGYYGIGIPFKVLPGEQVTCSMQATLVSGSHAVSLGVAYYDADGYLLSFTDASRTGSGSVFKTVTIPDNARTLFVVLAPTTAAEEWKFSDIQLERGSTATAYTPYRAPVTLPIPAAVQQLPGYGWSAGSVYNYIDWKRKVYVQRVASVDMGTLAWTHYTLSGGQDAFRSVLSGAKQPTAGVMANIICPAYTAATSSTAAEKVISIAVAGNASNVYVIDSTYSDAATFTSAMSGVYLYYELATPVETEISSLLTDDNLIQVEPGGTLSFPNALGDGYRIPVPTKVKYQRRGA